MKKLHLAADFGLPLEAVTQTFAVLARRGAGKTHNASVMAEEMLKAGQQIVAIDPTGAWWGLRSGFPVVIFGGDHADVPLEETAGELIAQTIIESRRSAVIDVSLFRKGQARRFLIDFLETLYRLNRDPLHLFVDEADDVCPQKVQPDEARLVGALEDVVKRGRKKGIGCSLITQRPQALNKDVLTQCEVLVAMRLGHPLDIKAIKEWVAVHADPEAAETMIKSLPSLPIGAAWFWSPGWGDFFQRVQVRRRETFDSSATPKPGEKVQTPKAMQEIDLAAFGEQIKGTVERAKENDPAALRKRIRELEARLKIEESRLNTANHDDCVAREKALRLALRERDEAIATLHQKIAKAAQVLDPASSLAIGTLPPASAPRVPAKLADGRHVEVDTRSRAVYLKPQDGGALPKAEKLILTALAHYPQGRSARQVAVMTEYSAGGGAFRNAVGALRSRGWIEGGNELLRITEAGRAGLGHVDPLPTGVDLLRRWQAQLGKAEREILDVLFEVFPATLTAQQIAEKSASRYEAAGGAFRNAMGKLRTLELIKGRREMVLSEELVG